MPCLAWHMQYVKLFLYNGSNTHAYPANANVGMACCYKMGRPLRRSQGYHHYWQWKVLYQWSRAGHA